MRIEIVCASRELFGSDRSAVRLAELLDQLGHEVSLALPQRRPERGLTRLASGRGLTAGPAAMAVASSRGASGLSGLTRLRSRSAAELTIYNSAAVAARFGDRRPRALVLREWLNPASWRHRALSALHARRMDAVIAISSGVAERWRACAGEAIPIEVCPNWLDEDWLATASGAERNGILFAGRLNAWKGQMRLADAFDQAFGDVDTRPPLTFVGAEGPGSPFHRNAVDLRRRCERSGWTLLDLTPDPRTVLAPAALVVVPSLRPEPFGNVILEGLATGARVVAFPGGGVDDLAPLFPTSLEVVARNTGALSSALARWWREGGQAQGTEEHAKTLATLRARFTASAVAPQWRRIIERLREPDQARGSESSASAAA